MFSDPDLTARARIRETALRLFADRDPAAVSLRQIAAEAGVSPGLVVHHFGSKEGLRMAVDEHVATVFDGLLAEFSGEPPGELTQQMAAGADGAASLAEAVLRALPPDSPIPPYLRRLLLSGEPAGLALFRRWYGAGRQMLDGMVAAGLVEDGPDPEMRAAFLMVNDLAMFLLREHVAAVLDLDPLGPEGMRRWVAEALAVYRHGIFHTEGES